MATHRTKSTYAYAFLFIIVAGCDGTGGPQTETLDIAVCNPTAGPFSLEIDNTYFPLPVGQVSVLEGDDEGTLVRVEITVLDETEIVAGVITRVVEEREFEDGELIEASRNFFAQAPDGTVCYFGEDVDDFEDGVLIGHSGQWRAGVGDNLPGIIMPGNPEAGQAFAQESAPGIAEDMAEIESIGGSVTVPAGTFDDVLRSVDTSPLDPGSEDEKVYAPGVGLIVDEEIELISVSPAGS